MSEEKQPSPGQAAYEAFYGSFGTPFEPYDSDTITTHWRHAWETGAQAAIKASDVEDDLYAERLRVSELFAVLTEIFTCLKAGDPALLDDDQVSEWRQRAGLANAPVMNQP